MEEQIDDTEYEDAMAEMKADSKPKKKRKERAEPSNEKIIDIEDRERALLSQLMSNNELFIKSIAFLEPEFFESKVNKIIVNEMVNYYEDYKSIPTDDIILLNTGLDDTRHDWLHVKSQWPHQYLEDQLNRFIKNMSMKGAIEDSIELLDDEDYGTIEKKIKDAVNVDIDVKLGVTVETDKFKELFAMLTSSEATIPTGWFNADDALEGGVTVPSLNYLLAKSGGGKSVGLINLAWNYVQMGRDVIYISLELKEEKIMKRYICHSAGIPVASIPNSEIEILKHLKYCDRKEFGRFTTHFYQPNTLSAMKLELFVRNYIQMYNQVPIIILDYAGLMVPNGKGWQGMFERDKYVSEELRGVATLFDTIVWTADQFNRSIFVDEKVKTDRGIINFGDIKVTDKILTHSKRMATINTVHEKQEQDCYEITLKSGKTIICSGKHMWPKADSRLSIEKATFDVKVIDNINTSLKVGDSLWTMVEDEEAYYKTQIKIK